MGLLGNLLGSLLGGLNSNQQGGMANVLSSLLTKGGGIEGLIQQFSSKGLGSLVNGWVSTGPNPPATPAQIEQVFGSDKLQQMAAQAGVDPSQISGYVAKLLPDVVDKLTPEGKPVGGSALEQGLSSLLQGGLSKFLGK